MDESSTRPRRRSSWRWRRRGPASLWAAARTTSCVQGDFIFWMKSPLIYPLLVQLLRLSPPESVRWLSIETANASAIVCIELGAMLEAHKYNEKVTHCMCIIRDDESSPYRVLSPCGICQERLRYWGENVQVAVTTEEKKIRFVELKDPLMADASPCSPPRRPCRCFPLLSFHI